MVKYQGKKDYFPFVNVSARAIKKSIVQKKKWILSFDSKTFDHHSFYNVN